MNIDSSMRKALSAWAAEDGATAAEYAIAAAAIAAVIVGVAVTLGGQVANFFQRLIGTF